MPAHLIPSVIIRLFHETYAAILADVFIKGFDNLTPN
jgi:hypothetical protein